MYTTRALLVSSSSSARKDRLAKMMMSVKVKNALGGGARMVPNFLFVRGHVCLKIVLNGLRE